MRLSSFTFGFGMAATAALVATAPATAAELYQIESGTTSLQVAPAALTLLQDLGLTFNTALNTVPAASGYEFGFAIVPPSADSSTIGSTLTFRYDEPTQAFSEISGTIEHTGGLSFTVDEDKLSLLSPLQIGNFSIGYANGFYLADNLTVGGLVLFDLVPTSAPTFNSGRFSLTTDVKVASAFNEVLTNALGVDPGLTGAVVGSAQVNAQAVPEPATVLGLLAGGALLQASRRRKVSQ